MTDPPKPLATERTERLLTRNEPPMNSKPNNPPRQLSFIEEDAPGDPPNAQRSASHSASIEKSALGEDQALMEEIVGVLNIETAWARTKANKGAPGPDGITVEEFPEWFRPQWETVRRQLIEGTCRPQPA